MIDEKSLHNVSYGLYVLTAKENEKDNGCIINTVSQVTASPLSISVTVNKNNFTHDMIMNTKGFSVSVIAEGASFDLFKQYGFKSGRNVNKFEGEDVLRSDNGLVFLSKNINSFMSLKVDDYVDLDTHGMFICSIAESRIINDTDTMTYTYYQNNVKPKPDTEGKKGYVCKICGYVYEGDKLPDDFICPLCKHPASDFEEIK